MTSDLQMMRLGPLDLVLYVGLKFREEVVKCAGSLIQGLSGLCV